jgi:hypothetical protein
MMMLTIPPDLAQKYESLLIKHDIPIKQRPYYFKWLRYYLDFCDKYQLEPYENRHFSAFDEKLQSKNQSEFQRQQAKRAIAIYYRGIVGHPVANQKIKTEAIKKANLGPISTQSTSFEDIKPRFLPENEIPQPFLTLDSTDKRQIAIKKPVSNSTSAYRETIPDGSPDSNYPKLTGADWVWVYERLAAAIQIRHYSPKTLPSL